MSEPIDGIRAARAHLRHLMERDEDGIFGLLPNEDTFDAQTDAVRQLVALCGSDVNALVLHAYRLLNVALQRVGVDPDQFDRHTAMGDARWAIAQYAAVFGLTVEEAGQ